MNFFDAQDKARRATRWLVIVYIVSTTLIVAGVTLVVGVGLNALGQDGTAASPEILGFTALAATFFILGSSLYKTSQLAAGGGRVAVEMGGTLVPPDVQDPLRKRLRNIVEEMAIASGVPVPEIYVLEQESGINAFAAGFTPGDAAIAVTRGTLTLLDRDELQGVIAHEFSHILNGDMRLNIRMMGVLFGIMVLGIIGRIILRGSYHSSMISSRRKGSSSGIVFVGLGLAILGWVGLIAARIIKAAVSRQREFLADASAVQFTRQTAGLADALKKIGGYTEHSYIQSVDPEEISHMLFAGGSAGLASIFATHPPLTERIQALDPNFRDDDYPSVDPVRDSAAIRSEQAAGFAASAADGPTPQTATAVTSNIADAVGRPRPEHVAYARRLRRDLPATLYDAAHEEEDAFLLTLALVLDQHQAERQLQIIERQLGAERAARVRRLFDEVCKAGPSYRLPLLEIAFPMLRRRPKSQLEYLLDLVRRLIETDGHIDLGEFCFYRILASHLSQAADPVADVGGNRTPRKKARAAALDVIRIVADQGNEDETAREHAYRAGIATFGKWAGQQQTRIDDAQTVTILGQRLDTLRQMNSAGRKSLLQALSNTITHDGKLTLTEAELLRVICASLDCPLPPILAVLPG